MRESKDEPSIFQDLNNLSKKDRMKRRRKVSVEFTMNKNKQNGNSGQEKASAQK